MPSYWLCTTSRENWEVVKDRKIWGVPSKHFNKISKVKKGDFIVLFKKRDGETPSQIVGVFRAASDPFYDEKRIFKDEVYPHRVKLEPHVIPGQPLDFKPLVPKLNFIRNKKKWSVHLMGKVMIELPKEDFETIVDALKV